MFCRSVHFSSCFSNRQRWRHVTSSEIYRFEKQVFFSPLREQINDKLPTGSISRWPLFFFFYIVPSFSDAMTHSQIREFDRERTNCPFSALILTGTYLGTQPTGDVLLDFTHTHEAWRKKKNETIREKTNGQSPSFLPRRIINSH